MLCVRFIFKGPISVDRLTAVKRHTATSANASFEKVLLEFVFTTFAATQACKCKKACWSSKGFVFRFGKETKRWDRLVAVCKTSAESLKSNLKFSPCFAGTKYRTQICWCNAGLNQIGMFPAATARPVSRDPGRCLSAFSSCCVSIGHHWFKAHMRAVIEPVANTFWV